MRKFLLLITFIVVLSFTANAQFNSGSTGADGALDLSTMTCPNNICEVQLPESGILNYTTVNVPQGKELRFKNNSRNTPVILLAQGQVTVSGVINVSSINTNTSGFCGSVFVRLGNGGFKGGFGPGVGTVSSQSGTWIGPLSLVPIIGGSGSYPQLGNGGGAIVMASSTVINFSGQISANGSSSDAGCGGPNGSGGAIRLVSNTINATGSFSACGGNCGVVRLEATSLTFTGASSPAAVLSPVNPIIFPTNPLSLTIASIGGYSVPSYAGTRFDTVDLLLPNQLSDPINVVIQGSNIPVGTQVQLQFSGSNATTTSCTLSGTQADSSATCTISNLNRTAVTYIIAVATFNPPAMAENFNPKGQNHVAKVRLEAVLGGKPKYVFLRADGTEVKAEKLSSQFLQQFGI